MRVESSRPARQTRTAALVALSCLLATGLSSCRGAEAVNPQAVLAGYRTLAHAGYTEAYTAAQGLQDAIAKLNASPSASTLAAARQAWRNARRPYSRTEALQFGNDFVDAWTPRVNAWPIDEGFIDYVADDYVSAPGNPQARLNLIAAQRVTIAGQALNTEPMRRMVLEQAQASSATSTNVATGYHAIEFMLWGQDLNGHLPGAGQRPWTDFAHTDADCTDGSAPAPQRHCLRRRVLLRELVDMLRQDLRDMASKWGPQTGSEGDRLVEGDPKQGLRRVLRGLTTMSGVELASKRLQMPLTSHLTELEQDDFSDDTHRSLLANAQSVESYYFGRLGVRVVPASLADLAEQTDAGLAQKLEQAFATTRTAMQAIADAGNRGQTFDTLIAPDNTDGAALIVAASRALQQQARLLAQLGQALELGALDPGAILQ